MAVINRSTGDVFSNAFEVRNADASGTNSTVSPCIRSKVACCAVGFGSEGAVAARARAVVEMTVIGSSIAQNIVQQADIKADTYALKAHVDRFRVASRAGGLIKLCWIAANQIKNSEEAQ